MEQTFYRLGEISKLYAGGDAPSLFSDVRTDDFRYPIFSNGLENEGLYGYSKYATMKKDTITISSRGTIGVPFYRKESYLPIVRLITIEPDLAKINAKYLYYYLTINKIEGYGTSQQQLTIPFMSKRKLLVYKDLVYQKRIADILSRYDELIENNNKQIATLENIFKSLYDEWFVKGRFSKNKITNSSELTRLGDLIDRKKTKLKDWSNVNIIDLANMPQFSININTFGKPSDFDSNIYKLEKRDLLFGSIRPYFGKAGFSSIDGGVCGTVYCFNTKDNINWNFILGIISSKTFIDYCDKCSSGTKMPVIDYDVMCRYKIILPNNKILEEYNKIINPIIDNIVLLQEKNRILFKQRDSLLPRLMSGKLSVEDIEVI